MLRNSLKLLNNVKLYLSTNVRSLTYYPIDDALFGLTEEQIAVKNGL